MADTTVNSADLSFSILEEVTPGVTPTVATRYELPTAVDQAPPEFSTADIVSNTKRPNRASNGTQDGMSSLSWSFAMRLRKSAYMDLLLKSALCGDWQGNKLSAGKKDTFFSIVTALRDDTAVDPAPANGLYYLDAGNIVNSVEFGFTAGSEATVTFAGIGLTRDLSEENDANSVTAVEANSVEMKYDDLKNVKLGTTDIGVSSLNLTVSHERELRPICGQPEADGIGTSGARSVSGTLVVYRKSFDINSEVTGAGQKLSFEATRNGVGYHFTLPAALLKKPTDSVQGSSVLATITFTASFDNTAQTDIFIERI